jgi:hypothetical protein
MPNLDTLQANKNSFKDLTEFLDLCPSRFPNLRNVSLLKNPMCPFLIGDLDYYQFRLNVSRRLPNLEILDGFEISMNDSFKPQDAPEEEPQTAATQEGAVEGGADYNVDAKGTIEYNKKYMKPRT